MNQEHVIVGILPFLIERLPNGRLRGTAVLHDWEHVCSKKFDDPEGASAMISAVFLETVLQRTVLGHAQVSPRCANAASHLFDVYRTLGRAAAPHDDGHEWVMAFSICPALMGTKQKEESGGDDSSKSN